MPVLKEFKTVPDLFSYLTLEFGASQTKPALLVKREGKYQGISYSEFYEEAELVAMGLASLGVKRGDKISLISENRPEWAYSDMAILGMGAINVPLYPISTADSIQYMLKDSEAVGIIVSNKFHMNKVLKIRDKCPALKFIVVMNDIEEAREYENVYTFKQLKDLGRGFKNENPFFFTDNMKLAQEDDLCSIIYTSGTTGEPKGVMLTHKNFISNVVSVHKLFDMNKDDTFLSFLPLCHVFERMAGYYTPLACGATIAYAEGIEKIATNLLEVKPTVMTAVPRLFERIYSKIIKNIEKQSEKKQKIFEWAIEIGKEYSELVRTNSTIPVTLNLKHKLADKLVYSKLKAVTGGNLKFFISGGAALSRDLGQFFAAVGILILEGYGLTESSPVIAVNRLNDYKFGSVGKPIPGVDVKIASDGEILASGPNIMKGYYKKKKETEEVLKDGWLHTGDIGVFDAEGFLIITDRKKHLFKTTGGKYIAPTPIENMFLASKYIDQFIIIGDRRMFITALVVPDFEALKEYADAHRIQYESEKDLIEKKQIYDFLEKEFAKFQKNLANYEKVRKFTLLDHPFSIETGEMTPSLKLKRKVIEQRYSDLIEDMYKSLGS
jgi:long-chain acyl-CoA synthetase